MQFLKKYWHLMLVLAMTAGLGVVTLLTSQKLKQTAPVAPTVPQATPKAAEPACQLTFALVQPTATPIPTATATPAPTATPTPTPSPTPRPTQPPVGGYEPPAETPTRPPAATATPRPTATPTPTATPRPTATATPTPAPEVVVKAPPPAAPTPKVPVAGAGPTVLGASVIGGGILLLLLGMIL